VLFITRRITEKYLFVNADRVIIRRISALFFFKLGRWALCKGRRAVSLFTGVEDLRGKPLSDCESSKYEGSERHTLLGGVNEISGFYTIQYR
jgi:hypothetical protein